MADIRQNSTIKDTFSRVENPLSFGGKWSLVDSAFSNMKDDGNAAIWDLVGGGYGWSYWTPDTYDGDEAEAWGCRILSTGPTVAWDLLLVTASSVGGSSAVDGYLFRIGQTTGGQYTELYRLDNAGGVLLVGHIFGPFIGSSTTSLIRRNGTSVEGWYSQDDGVSWILGESAVDTNYQTGLKAGIAAFGATSGWDCFGSGPAEIIYRQQIYRILHGTNPSVIPSA